MHPQDPTSIRSIAGRDVIVTKNGRPLYYLDGSPVNNGRPQCTAKSKNSQYRCQRRAVTDRTVCQMHGSGSVLQGRPGGRPSLTTGKYKLPVKLQERFERAISNPDLLSLSNEIALLDMRIGMLTERLPDSDKSAVSFEQLQEGMKLLKRAQKSKNTDLLIEAVEMLDASYDEINAERMNYMELGSLYQQRSKLTSRELELRKAQKAYITAEEAWALVKTMLSLVHEHVPDPNIRNIIAVEVKRALSRG